MNKLLLSRLNTKRQGKAVFIALPAELHTPVNGGCDCPFCKSNRHLTPMWDTLGVDHDGKDDTWVVHMPELA
jgi:hypothetical protein